MNRASRLVNWFVPADLVPADAVRRARVMVSVCLLLVPIALIARTLRALLLGPSTVARAVAFLGLLTIVGTPVLLRITRRMTPPLLFLVCMSVASFFSVAYENGGLEAPILGALALVPMMATFFGGIRIGLFATVSCLAMLGSLAIFHGVGHGFESIFATNAPSVIGAHGAVTVLAIAMSMGLAWVYEHAHQRAEKRLQDSEARYELAVEASNDGVFDWRIAEGTAVYSPNFRNLVLRSEERPLPATPLSDEVVAPADRAEAKRQLDSALAGQDAAVFECRLGTPDAGYRWFEIRWRVTRGQGRALRINGSVRDIQAHKDVNRLKNQFLSTVSHELRTPLTSIHGALGLMAGGAVATQGQEAAQLIDVAQRNSQRLLDLVNDLLDAQKLEAGALDLEPTDLDLRATVQEAISASRGIAEVHKVPIEFVPPEAGTCVLVHADGRRILQVLLNLLSNAVKFSPPGAPVTITCARDGEHIRVRVSDRGAGVPPDFQQRVFEPFAQADASSTRDNVGTGLGLAISKAIIEAHGGVIGFESEADQGATFFFTLPIARPASRPA